MGEKILIVDDDLESIKLIGLMLQRRGYEITAAHAGSQALIKAETEDPDLIILDVMMPDMDGYQVCKQLRSNPYTAHLPVLMFTAKTLVGDKVAGFQAGADDYLTKPIHPAELVSRVESLLQRAETLHSMSERLPRAHVVGVLGAKGGVGTSTLVVNLAMAAYQHEESAKEPDGDAPQVSIADLQTSLGSVALLLGETPQGGLTTLMHHSPDDLDDETIDGQIMTHSSGLRYLPASLEPGKGQDYLLTPQVNAVLNRMVSAADHLYLDLGNMLNETISQIVSRCDIVVVVVEPEQLCLTLAKKLLDELKSQDPPPRDLRVVIVERVASAYTQAEIEDSLAHNLTSVITGAAGVVRQAIEQGQPIVLVQPMSEIAVQLRDLSQKLMA